MADDSGRFDGTALGGLLKKLTESVIVPLVLGLFVSIGVATNLKLDDPANWPAWAIIAAVFVAVALGGEALRRVIARWRVPKASGKRIGLLLACLHGDKNDNPLRETTRESIKKELGDAVEIILWPEALRLGQGRDSDAELKANAKAQKWLKAKYCDLLVWGRVKGDKSLALRFTAAASPDVGADSYGLTAETLELPIKLVSDLGAAIASRVVVGAAPAATMSGQFIAPLMREAAARFEPIINRMNPAFDADTRGSLLHNYAHICDAVGEQSGSNEDLAEAVRIYREALKERTRDRGPFDWAMTQNNLGNSLRTLGERESGTARLDEAVTAFREALKEWTHEHTPYQWAMTQSNLGNALVRLGARESSAAWLDEAIKAYRAALTEWTREHAPLQWATTQNNLGRDR